jgi:hypothetical protein
MRLMEYVTHMGELRNAYRTLNGRPKEKRPRRRWGIILKCMSRKRGFVWPRPALGPTQPLTQWVPRALFLGVKRPGCEANYSLPSSAEVKE